VRARVGSEVMVKCWISSNTTGDRQVSYNKQANITTNIAHLIGQNRTQYKEVRHFLLPQPQQGLSPCFQ
jgi:hypothetical protein